MEQNERQAERQLGIEMEVLDAMGLPQAYMTLDGDSVLSGLNARPTEAEREEFKRRVVEGLKNA